jgi:hypothetical protein
MSNASVLASGPMSDHPAQCMICEAAEENVSLL